MSECIQGFYQDEQTSLLHYALQQKEDYSPPEVSYYYFELLMDFEDYTFFYSDYFVKMKKVFTYISRIFWFN
jgi:hypothetical protein